MPKETSEIETIPIPELSISHTVLMPVETATFFYDKFVEYKERSGEELFFTQYLGRIVLGGLHDLMEGRLPGK